MIDEYENEKETSEGVGEAENRERSEVVVPVVAGNGSFATNGEMAIGGSLPEDAAYLALPGANSATMQGPVSELLNSLEEK